MVNKLSRIVYQLNESLSGKPINENSNNPANLLVGQDVNVKFYDSDNNITDTKPGVIELITNEGVIVKCPHSQISNLFTLVGFNAHENGIEYVNSDNSIIKRFHIY